MDYKERLKNLKEDYRDKIADETIKMFYQGFEIDAVKSRIKGKYPEFSVADINDIVDKTFKNMSKKESYKEKLTLDDVALKKFGKRYNQLTSDEKKECNYIYSEWSDDDYDEGYKKKESYKKRLRSLKEGGPGSGIKGHTTAKDPTEVKQKKQIEEPTKKSKKLDYSEVTWKMDKFLPDDEELQRDFYDLIDEQDKKGLIDFFNEEADYDRMKKYMPKGGTLEDFVDSLIDDEYSEGYKKESSEENIIGYIHDCLLNNPSAGVNEIKNKIKTKYGMDIDMNTISKEINKFNSRESFREKLNKLKETMNGDKYIQLTGPFNLPKINNMVSQLCNDYGLVFAADGRIFYDDRNSLLKREINAFLAELKNIGLSYRLSEKMIKEKLNCLKI